ncbi:hypothetical protein K469DRAFT_696521 [Zopfia rhizophila CBS 207.26]|uniref:Uncharacterized protein n=1 Tax=Zopfia rhizophila CBS 207.26 TaxID=1314779 RepID=A0A6A6DGM6_9PEZI|nr:hypothetical protein K469DRAFT_696521 [Zopfia rhizophila CBS 207.26]
MSSQVQATGRRQKNRSTTRNASLNKTYQSAAHNTFPNKDAQIAKPTVMDEPRKYSKGNATSAILAHLSATDRRKLQAKLKSSEDDLEKCQEEIQQKRMALLDEFKLQKEKELEHDRMMVKLQSLAITWMEKAIQSPGKLTQHQEAVLEYTRKALEKQKSAGECRAQVEEIRNQLVDLNIQDMDMLVSHQAVALNLIQDMTGPVEGDKAGKSAKK